jgi:hypothetical protein
MYIVYKSPPKTPRNTGAWGVVGTGLAPDVLLSLDLLEQLVGLLGCAFVFATH